MVIAVAAVLSAAAMLLQPAQERNVRIEKIQSILTSAGIVSTTENAEDLFNQHIIAQHLIDRNGNIVNDGRNVFDLDLKPELKKLEDLEVGKSSEEPAFPIFVCKNGNDTMFIIPVLGKGLWGPLWGYVTLKNDYNTVVGAVFDHKGETPGLGAEIATELFRKQFVGKKIFDNNDLFVSVSVVKGGVANSNIDPEYGVDAISGGTITSNGLSEMLKLCLGNYVNYFDVQRSELLKQQEFQLEQQRIQDSIALAEQAEPVRPRRVNPPVETSPVESTESVPQSIEGTIE